MSAAALAAQAAALLGAEVARARPLAGGDLSPVLSIRFADGREAVVKGGPAPRLEAEMLEAIRAAGAPAPRVLGVDGRALCLEPLPDDGDVAASEESLGAAVATLHAARGAGYGWRADYAFGPVAIPNAPVADWPGFWAERRLLPATAHVDGALARRIEGLARRLPDLLPAHPPPALLHGDLWRGNVLAASGRVTGLIDPACHHGDGEVDLAMLTLFGGCGPAFRAGYGALAPGWAERRPIYQLWPALCHLRLFGAGYRGLVTRLLDAVGA